MTVSYERQVKHLVVTLDDGTIHTYHNVDSPAADALFCAPSLEHHWQKHIHPVYIRINPSTPAKDSQ